MDSIKIGDQAIPYQYVEKPWIRNTYLKFDDEKLVVTARNYRSAEKVVNMHKGWIYKHYSQVKNTVRLFRTNSILFNGTNYNVQHVPYYGNSKLEIVQNNIMVHSKSAQSAEKALDRWLSLQTTLFTDPIVREKARLINEDMPRTKTRRFGKWGVCKSNHTITFNAYLCMLPSEIRDYIVSHEVAHMNEMNHSKKFWEVVAYLCPNYKQLRKELKLYDNKRRLVHAPMILA